MKIKVVDYDPKWPIVFESERLLLQHTLGPIVEGIHHIGSTSVEGLAAKPIVDILLEAKSLELLDNSKLIFKSLGYEVMGEYGIPGRRYYRKGGDIRTHQIHAFKTGDENVHRHLAFRDYLKVHPEVQLEYQNLKFELAKSCNNDIECYCDGKDDFVKKHEARALEWIANI
jgi:GrpB-like predicted nucleotidyltransferase (UPF0157 family)